MSTKALTTVTALLAALLLCLTASAEVRERTVRTRPSAAPGIDSRRLAETIHGLINRERQKMRLKPLPWDEGLHRVARDYSRDMAERRFFSHTDPDGGTFADRYRDNGIACTVRTGNVISHGGENIAQAGLCKSAYTKAGKTSYTWHTEKEIAAVVVKNWMASRGHRKNILSPQFRKQGIGVFITPERMVYVTQNFC